MKKSHKSKFRNKCNKNCMVRLIYYAGATQVPFFFILGVRKWWKKYTLTDSFLCHCTSTEGTYHRRFGKCARFLIFRLQASYNMYQTKRFKRSYLLKYTLLNLKNLVKNWTTKKIYKISVVKITAIMLDWCNIWPLIMIFMD